MTTSAPRVISMRGRRGRVPAGAVYIGRAMPRLGLAASPLANPHRRGSRGEQIAGFRRHFRESLLPDPAVREYLEGIRGLDLACWCAPEPCHGDVIREYLESTPAPARVCAGDGSCRAAGRREGG